ncbi:MAG: DUF1963 domain-containing protein [Daejeonella sp.]
MESIKLRKKGTDPTGEDPNETCTIWLENTTFCWCHIIWGVERNQVDEGERKFNIIEEAEEAAKAMIADLQSKRFYIMEKRVPAPPGESSKPKKVGVKPGWLATLPKALLTQHAKFLRAAKAGGLAHRFAEIEELMRPGSMFSLRKVPSADVKNIISRIGGVPDLVPGQAWPEQNGSPLTFVAQILISDEIKALDMENMLPQSGLLSFFAQLDVDAPEYGERCIVLLFEKINELVPATPPSEACVTKKTRFLLPKPRLTLPPDETPVIEELALNRDESGVYADDLFLGPIPEGRNHTLLGWGTAATHYDINKKRFLAQFDSDHHIDFQMGDYNTLRFYIDGDVVNASTLKSAVCTLSEA